MDLHLNRIVHDDLRVLTRDWNQDIDDASLRISSPVLYRLLIEGALAKAANQIGHDIRVLTPAVCKNPPLEEPDVLYWQAGGAKYKGMEITATCLRNRAGSPEEIKASYERDKALLDQHYPVKLSSFIDQPVFLLKGTKVTRSEVIKYVNNKLGGRHYDTSRGSSPLEQKYLLLDAVGKEFSFADKNAVYYELLSIGQRLVNSRDVGKVMKRLGEACVSSREHR